MSQFSQQFSQALQHLHATRQVELIETHISQVFLCGEYAYKVKKPVDLGFLDFSSLEKRRYYCLRELELNRRLAPDLYLDVITITQSTAGLEINGEGEVVDYAVKLRRFNSGMELDTLAEQNALSPAMFTQLAQNIAGFHNRIAVVDIHSRLGTASQVHNSVVQTTDEIIERISDARIVSRLIDIKHWQEKFFQAHRNTLNQRKRAGFIRECHGDMHLRNMVLEGDDIIIFDGIEFNDKFRCIDVISEIAFLIMDLQSRGHADYACIFMNEYLAVTGDYDSITLLRYYLLYRALVRAKVDLIRAMQADISEHDKQQALKEFNHYLSLAESYIHADKPCLIITQGYSGSGKTFLANTLREHLFFIHLRSDIERKRLHGLIATQASHSALNSGIYTAPATEDTYAHLLALAERLLSEQWPVLVDAAFLHLHRRNTFKQKAKQLNAGFVILHCNADDATLAQRIQARATAKRDASEATQEVLAAQKHDAEMLTIEEYEYCVECITDASFNPAFIAVDIKRYCV